MTPEEQIKQTKRNYMQLFNSDLGREVLKDLGFRCFKHVPLNDPLHYKTRDDILINEGKRQVLLHIETMMSPEGMETAGASNTKEV